MQKKPLVASNNYIKRTNSPKQSTKTHESSTIEITQKLITFKQEKIQSIIQWSNKFHLQYCFLLRFCSQLNKNFHMFIHFQQITKIKHVFHARLIVLHVRIDQTTVQAVTTTQSCTNINVIQHVRCTPMKQRIISKSKTTNKKNEKYRK